METSLILLLFSFLLISFLLIYLSRVKKKTQLHKTFIILLCLLLFWFIGIISQKLFSEPYNIPPVYFEYFVYISACHVPVCLYFISLIFVNTKIKYKSHYLFLFIIPFATLITLWTNDYHNLFFKVYSTNMSEIVTGPMHTVNAIYTYLLLFWSVLKLIRYSIKNSGFFSKQLFLFTTGSLIPIIVNILGTFGIIDMTVYITPISFGLAISLYALAIFRFNFLGTSPIALKNIVNKISDSFVVLDDNGTVTDFNQTFLTTFNIKDSNIRGKSIIDIFKSRNIIFNYHKLESALFSIKDNSKTISFEQNIKEINKIFTIEVSTIYSDDSFLGVVILFKDITQHINDMNKIKDTQESLMESERLSSLGQLIGGIAHNLKTPIMSIAGAAEGLSDLIKEYDSSIDDPEVNSQDHHDIAKDMTEWINKIKNYSEYMSDVITAVKGQAVTLSESEHISFTIEELIKRVNILMKHELKNAIIYLNVVMKAEEKISINGDINSLVQVINNMISNSIQSYNGKTGENIDLIVETENNNLLLSVKDYGCGLPDKVKKKLFKEMITTKGKNGTGLGLYMSYSTIKANFNGNITFDSQEGHGTTFTITLPLEK